MNSCRDSRVIDAIGRARHAESRASFRHRRRDARHSRRNRLSVTIRFGIGRVVRSRKILPMPRLAPQRTGAPYRSAMGRHSSDFPWDRSLEIHSKIISHTRENASLMNAYLMDDRRSEIRRFMHRVKSLLPNVEWNNNNFKSLIHIV